MKRTIAKDILYVIGALIIVLAFLLWLASL